MHAARGEGVEILRANNLVAGESGDGRRMLIAEEEQDVGAGGHDSLVTRGEVMWGGRLKTLNPNQMFEHRTSHYTFYGRSSAIPEGACALVKRIVQHNQFAEGAEIGPILRSFS